MPPVFIFGPKFNKIVLPLLDQVVYSCDIVIFDWRFENSVERSEVQKFNNAIISLVGRGVRVRAIVNSEMICSRLNALGVHARVINSKKLLHTKMLILDNKKVIVGSHNYTESAFSSNYEVSVSLEILEQDMQLQNYFEALWSY